MTERLMIKDSAFSASCIHEQDFVKSQLLCFIGKRNTSSLSNSESLPVGNILKHNSRLIE